MKTLCVNVCVLAWLCALINSGWDGSVQIGAWWRNWPLCLWGSMSSLCFCLLMQSMKFFRYLLKVKVDACAERQRVLSDRRIKPIFLTVMSSPRSPIRVCALAPNIQKRSIEICMRAMMAALKILAYGEYIDSPVIELSLRYAITPDPQRDGSFYNQSALLCASPNTHKHSGYISKICELPCTWVAVY